MVWSQEWVIVEVVIAVVIKVVMVVDWESMRENVEVASMTEARAVVRVSVVVRQIIIECLEDWAKIELLLNILGWCPLDVSVNIV